jgi:hypothetical protein
MLTLFYLMSLNKSLVIMMIGNLSHNARSNIEHSNELIITSKKQKRKNEEEVAPPKKKKLTKFSNHSQFLLY